jgi:hypothetical protein
MDPLTAALTLVTAIIKLHQTTLEGMTPEQRIEYGKLVLADLQRWHDFIEHLLGHSNPTPPPQKLGK